MLAYFVHYISMNSIATNYSIIGIQRPSNRKVPTGRKQFILVIALMLAGLVLPSLIDKAWFSSRVISSERVEKELFSEQVFQYRGYEIEKIETGYISRELGIAAADANSLCRSISVLIYRATTGRVDRVREKGFLKADLDRNLHITGEEISLFSRSVAPQSRELLTNELLRFWGIQG